MTRLTYAELISLAPGGGAVCSRGAVPGEPLALLCLPSAIYLVAWLGAVRLGALPMALHTREIHRYARRGLPQDGPACAVYDARWKHLVGRHRRPPDTQLGACVEALSARAAERTGTFSPAASILPTSARRVPILPSPPGRERCSGDRPFVGNDIATRRASCIPIAGFIENARTNLHLYQGLLPRDRSVVPLSTAFIGCYNGWFPFLNAGACTIFVDISTSAIWCSASPKSARPSVPDADALAAALNSEPTRRGFQLRAL